MDNSMMQTNCPFCGMDIKFDLTTDMYSRQYSDDFINDGNSNIGFIDCKCGSIGKYKFIKRGEALPKPYGVYWHIEKNKYSEATRIK